MENNLLAREYVLENGIDYDDLFGEYCSDRILDAQQEDDGKPFTGLVYELYPNGALQYYASYVEGFEDGECVAFYDNGNIKEKQFMRRGQTKGKHEEWYANGEKNSVSEYSFGVCLSYTEWDEEGNVIKEKKEPTEDDIRLVKKLGSAYNS